MHRQHAVGCSIGNRRFTGFVVHTDSPALDAVVACHRERAAAHKEGSARLEEAAVDRQTVAVQVQETSVEDGVAVDRQVFGQILRIEEGLAIQQACGGRVDRGGFLPGVLDQGGVFRKDRFPVGSGFLLRDGGIRMIRFPGLFGSRAGTCGAVCFCGTVPFCGICLFRGGSRIVRFPGGSCGTVRFFLGKSAVIGSLRGGFFAVLFLLLLRSILLLLRSILVRRSGCFPGSIRFHVFLWFRSVFGGGAARRSVGGFLRGFRGLPGRTVLFPVRSFGVFFGTLCGFFFLCCGVLAGCPVRRSVFRQSLPGDLLFAADFLRCFRKGSILRDGSIPGRITVQ